MAPPQNFWETLFAGDEPQERGHPVQMRLLRKRGQPFLLLPCTPRLAATCLELYPAQMGRARAARTVLRWLLRVRVPIGAERISLSFSPDDPFLGFLCAEAGVSAPELPSLGVLAGNPASAGQRFVVLVFDPCQRPVAVVKTGLSETARALIQREASFLGSVPAGTRGIPRLRSTFQAPRLRALALDYCAGDHPRAVEAHELLGLLSSWVDPERKIGLAQLPDWVRLEQAGIAEGWFCSAARRLRQRLVQAVICHGDFTPWNIKVSAQGEWTVLDWERGELSGIPGWDWFHYVLQTGILVERLPTAKLVGRIERLLKGEAFKQYAERAAIAGAERGLVLAYLLHCIEVIRPAEGLAQTRDLLDALRALWPKE